jgi:flagellar basal body-associated protein FliL
MHPTPDYDFILNADQKPTKKPRLPSGNSKQSRILIVVIGAVALLIIAVIAMVFISNAGSAGKADLLKAAEQQAELIRISQLGVERAKGTTAKNLATTASFSLQSDQAILRSALSKNGITLSDKQLLAGKNEKTDAVLTSAEQSNKFDEVFIQTMQTQLKAYQQTLKSAYDSTGSKSLKTTLSTQFEHADLLASVK